MVKNPILRGFHPDPSLIRVGDDYYLATSTFEWAPGVRIYHSKDLAHWDYLTAPLDTYSKMDLRGVKASDGIWAPCLSHDGEYFYLIYTVVHDAREFPVMDTPNYLIRAKEITGPLSDPVYLNSSGFDPSLFHDIVDQIINNWLHFTKRLLVKFHRAYKSNDRLLALHLFHQNIYKFCLQVPALY